MMCQKVMGHTKPYLKSIKVKDINMQKCVVVLNFKGGC